MKPSPRQREALRLAAEGKFYPALIREEDGWHARWLPAVSQVDRGGAAAVWLDEFVRGAAMTPMTEDAEDYRYETLHDAWITALRSRTGLVRWDDAECAAFAAELAEWAGAAEEDVVARRAIVFAFSCRGGSAAEGDFRLACAVPHGRRALRALGQAAYVLGSLRGLRRSADGRLEARLTHNEAEDFVRRGARELADAGYTVTGVKPPAELAAAAAILPREGAPGPAGTVKLTVRVDGEAVTAEEIRFLLEQGSTFVFFRDRWIEVDRGILREALRALERQGEVKGAAAVSFALGLGHIGRLELADVTVGGALGEALAKIRRSLPERLSSPAPAALAATLRDYQARGAAWMRNLTDLGYGALLADDMGLGKTVQTIAWMLSVRESTPAGERKPFLVVAPLTLLSNWEHEFARFAPELAVYVHQGEGRHRASGFRRAASAADVVITSYNLLVREHLGFGEIEWAGLVLDEAQQIKNPDTQAAKGLRALMPPRRVALTGTPIENSPLDLWSIEEFLNPGLLGERKDFIERFVKPLETDPLAPCGRRLGKAMAPFVLRRLKSDPGIAAELGGKLEVREYCALSPAQRGDYEAALADYRTSSRRQGDVFALLTRLKLVCDGYSGERFDPDCGKYRRLRELVGEIFAAGESALVFTQYAKVGRELTDRLAADFSRRFQFLHGALTAAERNRAIRAFQSSRRAEVFVLSLKAGGFGLNLTKATHVIHYDRWWNPAVENQATDRAHRIGQERDVFVHAFVTAGTLEERIDDILARKQTLEGLVKDGEELLKTVRLD